MVIRNYVAQMKEGRSTGVPSFIKNKQTCQVQAPDRFVLPGYHQFLGFPVPFLIYHRYQVNTIGII
jgi:hypothetical protein